MPEFKGPPAVIWLQWHGDERPDEDGEFTEPDPDHNDVTWCQNKVFDGDVEYVRSTQFRQALELLKGYNDVPRVREFLKEVE